MNAEIEDASKSCAGENANDQKFDDTDTKLFSLPQSLSTDPSTPPTPTTHSTYVVFEETERYNMRHKRRGVALIINHEYFENNTLRRREGTENDALTLKKSFEALNYDVRLYQDLKWQKLKKLLSEVSQEDHKDADSLLIVIMTHGEDGGILHSSDAPYLAESIWETFTTEKVPSLAGKPKIFIMQACRGTKVESSTWVTDSTDSSSSPNHRFSVPTHADFLIVHSTMEGFYSWRNPSEGSWFIQDLCKIINKFSRTKDFMTILTLAMQRVAYHRFSNVPKEPRLDKKKQMPVITSTLTRLIYFDETTV